MSGGIERSFFNVRYTIPGFTFLMLILGAIASWLFESTHTSQIPPEILIVIVGTLFLLNGAPFGFVVSQPWYLVHKILIVPRTYLPTYRTILHSELSNPELLVIIDLNMLRLATPRQYTYLQRRFDLLHLLGSEIFAILLGVLFSTILRWILLPESFMELVLPLEYVFVAVTLPFLIGGLCITIREHSFAVRIILHQNAPNL